MNLGGTLVGFTSIVTQSEGPRTKVEYGRENEASSRRSSSHREIVKFSLGGCGSPYRAPWLRTAVSDQTPAGAWNRTAWPLPARLFLPAGLPSSRASSRGPSAALACATA